MTAGEVRRAESVDSQYDCREEEGKSGTVSVRRNKQPERKEEKRILTDPVNKSCKSANCSAENAF